MAVSRFGGLMLSAAALLTSDVIGFQHVALQQQRPVKRSIGNVLANKSSPTQLAMSSIPEDDDSFNMPVFNIKEMFDFKLPPLPEDHLALSGDIVTLFVYSYVDHCMSALFNQASHIDLQQLQRLTLDPHQFAPIPVWFDPYQITEHGHWLIRNGIENPYAPAIAASGLAFTSISFCWIICGYFTEAFQMRNTLECDTSDAILVVGRTWMFTALLMVGLALGSDYLWQQIDLIHPQSSAARGGMTTADMDFIFDSVTTLAFWRMVYNVMLGYRRK